MKVDKKTLNHILNLASQFNASDIHLSSGALPRIRTKGDIIPLTEFNTVLTSKDISNILLEIMDKYSKETLLRNLQTDFAYYNEENKGDDNILKKISEKIKFNDSYLKSNYYSHYKKSG